jgi:hypothetical protein
MAIKGNLGSTEDEFISDIPELYHYTNLDGITGIINSGSLWATHFSGLNDSLETLVFKDLLYQPLSKWLEKHIENQIGNSFDQVVIKTPDGLALHDVASLTELLINQVYSAAISNTSINNSLSSPTLSNPYICSFCSHSNDSHYERKNGLLSQWRGGMGQAKDAVLFSTRKV